MKEANVIFTFNGVDLSIQCTIDDKMKDICKKYSNKMNKEINSFLFLYGGNQVNFELSFKEQANYQDLKENKMNILVYEKEIFNCPECLHKKEINTQKLNEIILSNNEIIESINGIKFQIDNIIKNNENNTINTQLKNINKMLIMINTDIKNNEEKITNLFCDYNNSNINYNANNNFKKNINNNIISIKYIKSNDIYKKIFSCVNEKKN